MGIISKLTVIIRVQHDEKVAFLIWLYAVYKENIWLISVYSTIKIFVYKLLKKAEFLSVCSLSVV